MHSLLITRMNLAMFLVTSFLSIMSMEAMALGATLVGKNNIFVGEYMTKYTSRFESVIEATPTGPSLVGLAGKKVAAFSDIAVTVRFNSSGKIDVMSGSAYNAGNNVSYQPNALHRFRLIVDPALKRFKVFVKIGSGVEQVVMADALFRSSQSSLSYNNYFSVYGESGGQVSAKMTSLKYSSESLSGGSTTGGSSGGSSGGSTGGTTGGSTGGTSGGSSGGSTGGTTGGTSGLEVRLFPEFKQAEGTELILPSNAVAGDVVSDVSSYYKFFHNASPSYSLVSNTSNNNFAVSSSGVVSVSSISGLVAGQTYSIQVKAQDSTKGLYDQNQVDIRIVNSSDIVFIDPSYSGSTSNGARATPFKSWSQASSALSSAGKYILQKRGTNINVSSGLNFGANNVTIGSYGSGNLPVINNTSTTSYLAAISSRSGIVIRDIHLINPLDGKSVVNCSLGSYKLINSKVKGGGSAANINGCSNLNLLNNELYEHKMDGVYTGGSGTMNNMNFRFNYIHHTNLAFFPGATEQQAPGDSIQFNGTIQIVNVEYNVFDRSNSGHKFCLILSPRDHQTVAKFNYNYCKAPGRITNISGIYLENVIVSGQNTNPTEIIGNKIEDVANGMYLKDWSNLKIHSNQIIDSGTGISLMTDVAGEVFNNLFKNTTTALSVQSSSGNIRSKNNIFDVGTRNAYGGSGLSKIIESDNNLFSALPAGSWNKDLNSVKNQAPVYFNAAAKDFHQRSTSPAFDLGADLPSLNKDIEGQDYSTSPHAGPYQIIK